jgi:NAD-dependent dihydropyrimidine dehydrogenase PreA subunit
MSDEIKSSAQDPALVEIPTGADYRAVIDFEKCTASGECIPICPEEAIYEGPKRLPSLIACTCAGSPELSEMLPGKALVNYDRRAGSICTGCGDCIPVCPSNAIEMVPVSEVSD